MRRVGRVDANQPAIVAALRAAGYSVQPLHRVGEGVPDLLVGAACRCGVAINVLLEVKDGAKRPSARALTPDQARWHGEWRGQVAVVLSPDEALDELNHVMHARCPVCGYRIRQ